MALAAEFPRLEEQPDWPRTICERCGLAHHCTGTPVTLALFRYSVREVLTAYRETETGATVFAVPTVLDLPMSNVSFSAPTSLHSGHAVGLAPRSDCAHLAAELIHAGARGAQQLAEAPDFLADLLAQPSLEDHRATLIESIDSAVIQWMEERADWSPARIDEFGTRAYVAQFSDALAIVARLPLSLARRHLMDDLGTWDDRFRSMRWPGDIDLLRQFNVALAQHQPDGRLASRWFEACDEAAWAGPYWRSGLTTGLLGLRKIPDAPDAQPERLVATALARFAALSSQRHTDSLELQAAFRRHVVALTAFYPRHDTHWNHIWADALATLRGFRKHRHVVQDEWLRPALPTQMFPEADEPEYPPGGRRRTVQRPAQLPTSGRLSGVVRSLRHARPPLGPSVWRRTRGLIRDHWEYAWASGDSHYAVRTTHNLCDRLLRKHPSQANLAEVHEWTLQALQAESGDAHIWDLWAKVLAALGAWEASLDVRWKAVRRFPNNVVIRNSLGDALLDRGRYPLAERLLRETLRDFPNDLFSLHLLARAMLRLGRPDEANAALSEITSLDPDNPYAITLLEEMSDEQRFGANAPLQVHAVRGEFDVEPRVRPFVELFTSRTALLESYFAPSTNGQNDSVVDSASSQPGQATSEIELVVACRGGGGQRHDDGGLLHSWARVRPASYSTRLLLLSRAVEAGGLHREEISRVETEFPEHRSWNQWLGYGFVQPRRRAELRRIARKEKFWGGRLKAVYPGLGAPPSSKTVSYDAAALRRLFEDVALASADAGLPSVPLASR